MKTFHVIYKRKTTNYYWTFIEENLKAKGIMHAQKLAHDHLTELKKLEPLPMRIGSIKEIPPLEEKQK